MRVLTTLGPLLALACVVPTVDTGGGDLFPPGEVELIETYDSTSITVAGRIVDAAGTPIEGAQVVIGEATLFADASGDFTTDLPRRNALVHITNPGYRPTHLPLWLAQPLDVARVDLKPVVLDPDKDDEVRFLFGGDVAMGRRYLDPDESTPWDEVPPDDPEAIIQPSDPLPGSIRVVDGLLPYFQDADYRIVNLESVVTDTPTTPHDGKPFVYFTLPGSLGALTHLGIQYVSLGNNHVYDYLEGGVGDTLQHVAEAGLGFSGLGYTPEQAWAPYDVEIKGHPYSMVSANSVAGLQYDIGFNAGPDQGGAADLVSGNSLRATLGAVVDAGRTPIALWHTGQEYTTTPTAFAVNRMQLAADEGAALVIGNHPHMSQGFEMMDDTFVAHSLGNTVFEQQRLETMPGLLAQVLVRGAEVLDAQAIPILLEDYLTRPVTGELAALTLRRSAMDSRTLDTYVYNGRLELLSASTPVDRTVTRLLAIPEGGTAVLDLRDLQQIGESLSEVAGPFSVRAGHDLLLHGNIEDMDVDVDQGEVSHWDVSSTSRFACLTGARRGVRGLCAVRGEDNLDDAVIAFRNRVRVDGDSIDLPNKDLTLLGWAKGDNSGPQSAVVRYYASFGEAEFGEEIVWAHEGGTFPWTRYWADLHMPNDVVGGDRETNPRALRLFLHHTPPRDGDYGLAMWDDLAVVAWEDTVDATDGATLTTPHYWDYLRITGTPGIYTVTLVFRGHDRDLDQTPDPGR